VAYHADFQVTPGGWSSVRASGFFATHRDDGNLQVIFLHKMGLTVSKFVDREGFFISEGLATKQPSLNVAKHNHESSRQELIQQLYNQSFQKVITDFIAEMDAKNKAYYFILESGNFEAFKNYCNA